MRYSVVLLLALAGIVLSSFSGNDRLTVKSSAFNHNGFIPPLYSCEGENINPPLSIENIPKKAVSLAIIVHDPDAPMEGGFTHWVLWNIDPTDKIIKKYGGGSKGVNSTGQKGYVGMCPPSGTHHYYFIVYALDTKLNLHGDINKNSLEKAMDEHILAKGQLIGLYKKLY